MSNNDMYTLQLLSKPYVILPLMSMDVGLNLNKIGHKGIPISLFEILFIVSSSPLDSLSATQLS